MRKFAASIYARRDFEQQVGATPYMSTMRIQVETAHEVMVIISHDLDAATGLAYREAKIRYPGKEGWQAHDAQVVEIEPFSADD